VRFSARAFQNCHKKFEGKSTSKEISKNLRGSPCQKSSLKKLRGKNPKPFLKEGNKIYAVFFS
jgi:hypothetical protein